MIQLIWPFKIWKKIKRTILKRRFLRDLSILLGQICIKIYFIQCLIIVENCSGLRISSRNWNMKQDREGYLFLRCCRVKRENWKKKPRKWEINTVGLSSSINPLDQRKISIHKVSCNSNLKSYQIRKTTDTFMKQCWFFLARSSNLLLKEQIFQNLK